jgi:hypothetical protein
MELKIKNGSPLCFKLCTSSYKLSEDIASREPLILVAAMWVYSETGTSLVLV